MILEPEILPQYIKQLPMLCSLIGIFISYLYVFSMKNINKFDNFFSYKLLLFFSKRWYFDLLYNKVIYFFLNISYYHFVYILDRGIIEFLGPSGIIEYFTNNMLIFLNKMQSGYIYHYGYYLIFGLMNCLYFIILVF